MPDEKCLTERNREVFDTEMSKLWERLADCPFGTVGIQFTVHEGAIVYVEPIGGRKVRV